MISDKISLGKKSFICFIGWKDNEKLKPIMHIASKNKWL